MSVTAPHRHSCGAVQGCGPVLRCGCRAGQWGTTRLTDVGIHGARGATPYPGQVLRRLAESRALRWLFVALALAFAIVALVRYGAEAQGALRELHWHAVLLSGLAGLGFVVLPMLAWRTLMAGLGSPLPLVTALRVVFLSQLGKYVPGSIWPFVAQVELGREHGVPRRRSLTVGLLTVGVSVVVGLAVAAATLPLASPDAARRYWWILAATPLLLGSLHPVVLNPVLDRLLRLVRRPALEQRLTLKVIAVAAAWSGASWALAGLHVWALARDLGAVDGWSFPAALGAYALAWSLGLLIVIAPAGLGVREVVLGAGLAPMLDSGAVLVVVIASRLLLTLADLGMAGAAVVLGRRHVAAVAPDELADAAAARAAARLPARAASRAQRDDGGPELVERSNPGRGE